MPLWKQYAQKLKDEQKMGAWATMNSPLILKGETIVVQISNIVQKNTLSPHAEELIRFLREKLNVPSLKMVARVLNSPSQAQGLATATDHMAHLIKKYPAVQILQKTLDLEP